MTEQDAVLADLRSRHDDLIEKLEGRKPFAVPTDDFRRAVLTLGLAATKDAIAEREAELAADPEAVSDDSG